MNKEEAIEAAQKAANETGVPQTIWLVGPNRYVIDEYRLGDQNYREAFIAVLTPDQ